MGDAPKPATRNILACYDESPQSGPAAVGMSRAPDQDQKQALVRAPTKPRAYGLVTLEQGVIAAAVGIYAFLDDLLLDPILVAAAVLFPWYLTLAAAAVLLTFINISCCNWLQRRWDSWVDCHGARLEARVEKLRRGRLTRYPIRWITRDSDVWATIAAGLIGTVIVVGVIRLLGGRPVGHRRLVYASVAYSEASPPPTRASASASTTSCGSFEASHRGRESACRGAVRASGSRRFGWMGEAVLAAAACARLPCRTSSGGRGCSRRTPPPLGGAVFGGERPPDAPAPHGREEGPAAR
jgi:hypothetical protein